MYALFAILLAITALIRPAAADPNQGPGGPILVITSSAPSAKFGAFYAEILRSEGFNAFAVADISVVNGTMLANYDVAILAKMTLSTGQVTTLTDWVNGGGNLVAMDPGPELSTLLGISTVGSTLSNAYLRVDNLTRPGNGIYAGTMQFHGTATQHSLTGASRLATLYSGSTVATSYPAVTLRSAGLNGGQAAAFTYDLAASIVYTRQGNPAWVGQERDGSSPIRPNDLFYGSSESDPQPNWIDLAKVHVPQADEQQRFLANLITHMTLDRKPLPRFWYLPKAHRAAVLLTGDEHGGAGWTTRFDQLQSQSPAGCSLANWECLRATVYTYPSTPVTNQAATAYQANGFEVALHVSTGCGDFTASSIDAAFVDQMAQFAAAFPNVAAPSTNRTHCIAWSGWTVGPKALLNYGIRLDTNYYYWPPGWVNNTPGHFTGSAMPMRFADLDGTLIDVYQAVTQITDESQQAQPYTIDTLLDRALGPDQQFGVITVNAHTDAGGHEAGVGEAVIASAISRGVPIVTSRQLLEWLDARNSSSFGSLAWNGGQLSFTVFRATGANGLTAQIPARSATGTLANLTRDGAPVLYELASLKGTDYAVFDGVPGGYLATYVADNTAPTVAAPIPVGGAVDVADNVVVTALFSESMDPATISGSTFELRTSADVPVAAAVVYDTVAKVARLQPTSSLAAGVYTATVKGGATDPRAKDLLGNAMAASFSWSFTVGITPPPDSECPCSAWGPTAVPALASADDPAAVELGVRFRPSVNGFVTGVRFYKGAANTGTHVGKLWTSGGTLLATAVFSNESASGWQTVTFSSPIAVTANTVYVASYFAPNGGYAVNANYFASTGMTNGPLYLLRDGEAGGNGLYRYGAGGGFPSSTYQASNYWVDVVFTTAGVAPDLTPPTVTASTPAGSATAVPTSATVTATFSEALDVATINSSTFELRAPGNALVPATVTYSPGTSTATLTPVAPLSPATVYTATLRGGTTDPRVKDVAGNALAASLGWSFTTAATANGGCPCSVWDPTVLPAVASANDPGAVELGVRFRGSVSGFVTGIRFYKGATNTGTHVGNLWTSGGTLLASATFTGETATGWQTVTFASPVAITANTVYVASYFAPNGNYAINSNFFTASGVTSGPLTLLSDAEAGGNGVYRYGASSAFPNSSWQASNYWVDVVFDGTVAPDTPPPTVLSVTPQNGASGVSTASTVSVTFSEPLNSSTVGTSTFELLDAANAVVPASVSYNAANFTATLTPTAALAASTTYTARARGGVTDPRIKDLAGIALAQNYTSTFTTGAAVNCSGNPIVAENCLAGSPASEWDVSGVGDPSIQGFATDISVNRGDTVNFKVATNASSYRFDIYRLGFYGGNGARKVATVQPSATLPQNQPGCLNDAATGLIDCGNWAVSGSWTVPANATSGIYIAKVIRTDNGGASHIVFIVRNDASTADILFQTADTTWQAYNTYGGNSLYEGLPVGRAYKVSYNRPFNTRAVDNGQDWLFNAEYPMVRWLEANGYHVSYTTGVDSERAGALIRNHRMFMSNGHDEYWSAGQRANVETARDAGVHLAFFSGNEVFWKTRWENSIDGSGTPHRTMVSYKETKANAKIDPDAAWTGTWRDPRFSPPADGGRPENALTGQIFTVNDGPGSTTSIVVPEVFGKMRLWRNTSIANLAPGASATLPFGTLGYEWDEDLDNGFRPAGLVRLSSTTVNGVSYLQDYGSTYATGNATHALTLYKAPSGALVFGAGTVQWAWGLDANHDRAGTPTDPRLQQATVNLFADMRVQPVTLQPGLVAAFTSTDGQAPTTTIVAPAAGATLEQGTALTISGTATDAGGGVVGGVEVSVDGGTTWRRANGLGSWTYAWTPSVSGPVTIKARAADDSGNLGSAGAGTTVTVSNDVTCPCTIWSASATPTNVTDPDTASIEVGVKFRSDVAGFITGIRFYKGPGNGGTHVGNLWTAGGVLLATATFTGETASGWQQVNFSTPVAIAANTVYVASYFAPQGRYSGDNSYFATSGVDRGVLHALSNSESGGNGDYAYRASSGFPGSTFGASNYWVDVVFEIDAAPIPVTVPNVVGLTQGSAATAIAGAGLVVGTVTQQVSTTVPAGNVISQSPVSGTSVAAGAAVALVVSTGAAPVSVPNVVNLTQAAATTALTNAGLLVGTVTQQSSATVLSGSVISQSPLSGTSVAAGSSVNLVVSSGPAPDSQAPSTPSGFSISKVNGKPRLTWTASTDNVGVAGYRIHRSTNGTFGPQVATSTSTDWTDNTVQEAVRYTYAVVAFDAAGNASTRSALRSVTAGAAPTTPTTLRATLVNGNTQVQLTWNASTDNVGVVEYVVYRSTVLNTQGAEVGRSTTTAWVDTAVTRGARYTYAVRARDAANYLSGRSNFATITIP